MHSKCGTTRLWRQRGCVQAQRWSSSVWRRRKPRRIISPWWPICARSLRRMTRRAILHAARRSFAARSHARRMRTPTRHSLRGANQPPRALLATLSRVTRSYVSCVTVSHRTAVHLWCMGRVHALLAALPLQHDVSRACSARTRWVHQAMSLLLEASERSRKMELEIESHANPPPPLPAAACRDR